MPELPRHPGNKSDSDNEEGSQNHDKSEITPELKEEYISRLKRRGYTRKQAMIAIGLLEPFAPVPGKIRKEALWDVIKSSLEETSGESFEPDGSADLGNPTDTEQGTDSPNPSQFTANKVFFDLAMAEVIYILDETTPGDRDSRTRLSFVELLLIEEGSSPINKSDLILAELPVEMHKLADSILDDLDAEFPED